MINESNHRVFVFSTVLGIFITMQCSTMYPITMPLKASETLKAFETEKKKCEICPFGISSTDHHTSTSGRADSSKSEQPEHPIYHRIDNFTVFGNSAATNTGGSSYQQEHGFMVPAVPQAHKFTEEQTNVNEGGDDDVRPPYSYAALIVKALNSTADRKLILRDIYEWIWTEFPYYKKDKERKRRLENSIRHNLSIDKCFIKITREPGDTKMKGCFWTYLPEIEEQFQKGNCRRRRRMKATAKKPSTPTETFHLDHSEVSYAGVDHNRSYSQSHVRDTPAIPNDHSLSQNTIQAMPFYFTPHGASQGGFYTYAQVSNQLDVSCNQGHSPPAVASLPMCATFPMSTFQSFGNSTPAYPGQYPSRRQDLFIQNSSRFRPY